MIATQTTTDPDTTPILGVPLRVYWEQACELVALEPTTTLPDHRRTFEVAAHLLIKAMAARERQAHDQHTQSTAHDLNNIATAVQGFSAMLMDDPLLAPHLHPFSRDLNDAGLRIQSLARSLLHGLPTPPTQRATRVLVAPLIEEAAAVARMHAPPTIRLLVQISDRSLATTGDATLLHAALVNVLINAIHATMDAPEHPPAPITIAAETAPWPDTAPPVGGRGPLALQLTVRDEGCGMPPETLARARLPHFTTKSGRGGTGLGLVTVQRVAEETQGVLHLTSSPAIGTTVTLYLPLADRQGPSPQRPAAP